MLDGAFISSHIIYPMNKPCTMHHVWDVINLSHSKKSVTIKLRNDCHKKYGKGTVLQKRIKVGDFGDLYVEIGKEKCFYYNESELKDLFSK